MPAWKVMFIGVLACVCFASTISTLLAPMIHTGNDRWVWMGGSFVATLVAVWIFSIVLRHASAALDAKPRRGQA